MMIRRALTISLTAVIALLSTQALSRALYDNPGQRAYDQMVSHKTTIEETPYVTVAAHRVGQLALTVTNQGTFGTGFAASATCGGEACPSAEFPINSNVDYLFAGAFWVGAVVGRDTLVSNGADGWSSVQEMWPASQEQQKANFGDELMKIRSISDPDDPEFALALSEQDITCVYFDTLTEGVQTDGFENRPHIPLGMKIRQSSYAWSYSYAEDFVLFDYKI
ncbi:MAG TPA: hypothetical protein VLB27_12130, partial [candidate division Zixibacteria bacterium]|nr:hypothetical protein [candidate division Zixibacteria bacterium]